MNKINRPANFATDQEYRQYYTCLAKLKPGDIVEAHFYASYNNRWRPSAKYNDDDEKTRLFKLNILGKSYTDKKSEKHKICYLLGSNNPDLVLWSITNGSFDKMSLELIPNKTKEDIMKEYKFGYWSYHSDIKIAKIIKNVK